MKKLIISLGILAILLVTPAAYAAGPTIWIENHSSVVSDAEIIDDLPAFQDSVTQDLAPIWGTDAELRFGIAPYGGWKVSIEDTSDIFGALGYHGVTGVPFGKVFAADTKDYGGYWEVTFTHELQELLVDPWTNRGTLSKRVTGIAPRWWLTEVSDPVESDKLAYWRPGASGRPIPISDFITPAWYGGKGPYDFKHYVKKPMQILRGGYACFWQTGQWGCINNFNKPIPFEK